MRHEEVRRSPSGGQRPASVIPSGLIEALEAALRLPDRPESRWHRAGVGRRTERVLDLVFGAVLMTFAIGWTWAIADARASQGPLDETTTGATASIGAVE